MHHDDNAEPETCLIYLRNNKKLLGRLVRIIPEETDILFLPARGKTNEIIPLNQIKSMRLVQPLQLKEHHPTLDSRAEEVFPASERQPYTIEFHDREIMQGETLGVSDTVYSLYLFFPTTHEKVIRCFIPHQAIAHYQLGLRLGEILVDEKLASREAVDEALNEHITSQCLQRRRYLCTICKRAFEAETSEIEALTAEYTYATKLESQEILQNWKTQHANKGKFKLYRAAGCDYCSHP